MENLIEQIESKINNQKSNQRKDGMILIQFDKDIGIDSKHLNKLNKASTNIDLTSMSFNEVLPIIKSNKQSASEYFKYELYKTLTKKEDILSLIKQFTIPYQSIKQFLQHIFTLQYPSDILIEFINKNNLSLTEDHILMVIKHGYKLKKASTIIELITKLSIDVKYMMDLISQSKQYQLNFDILSLLFDIIKIKKDKKIRHMNWLVLIKNLITIQVIQKDTKQSEYDKIIDDIDQCIDSYASIEEQRTNEAVNNDTHCNWDMDLHNKLHNKTGVIIETILV